jgi:hypothetical protein
MKYEYKCVQALFTRDNKKSLSTQAEEIINKYSADGWEYHNTATTDEISPAGCLGALLGKKDILLQHSLFVFRKQKNG